MSNAIKYTINGQITINAYMPENGMLAVAVKDSGVGIREDQLNSLFTAFKKITSNRQLNKHGVGLGLTLSKNLA